MIICNSLIFLYLLRTGFENSILLVMQNTAFSWKFNTYVLYSDLRKFLVDIIKFQNILNVNRARTVKSGNWINASMKVLYHSSGLSLNMIFLSECFLSTSSLMIINRFFRILHLTHFLAQCFDLHLFSFKIDSIYPLDEPKIVSYFIFPELIYFHFITQLFSHVNQSKHSRFFLLQSFF